MKTIIAIFASVLAFLPAQAGLFGLIDDPLELTASSTKNAKTGVIESLTFVPSGKCEAFYVFKARNHARSEVPNEDENLLCFSADMVRKNTS